MKKLIALLVWIQVLIIAIEFGLLVMLRPGTIPTAPFFILALGWSLILLRLAYLADQPTGRTYLFALLAAELPAAVLAVPSWSQSVPDGVWAVIGPPAPAIIVIIGIVTRLTRHGHH
ncbi:MAG TPA: hypothetical protein VLF67_03035 [Candidatus Saccharimonas sp.]|nr:hypothetical protein [Candidatus Saccharimonas sp.]